MGDAGGVIRAGPVDRAETRREAEEAQDAQMVLGDAGIGIADEMDATGCQIHASVEIVDQRPVKRIGIKRVHREVAPRGIGLPVGAERHGRAPPVGRDVAAQRGDLHRPVMQNRRHGAMCDPRRHRLEARSPDPLDDLGGLMHGGDIDILDRQPEQPVAHGAADKARLALPRPKRRAQIDQARPVPPLGLRQCRGQDVAHGALSAASIRRRRLTRIAAVTPQIRRSAHRYS